MTERRPLASERPELDAYLSDFGQRLANAEPQVSDAPVARVARGARRERRRRLVFATAGLAVAAVVAVLAIVPAITPVDPVSEARAALGDSGDLVHYVIRSNDGPGRANGGPCAQRRATKVWQATSGRPRWRVIRPGMPKQCGTMGTWDGTLTPGPIEMARDGDTQTTWYPQIRRLEVITETDYPSRGDFPSLLFGGPQLRGSAAGSADPIDRLRALLDEGTLREGRRGRLNGRDVVHLVGTTREGGGRNENQFDLAVDAQSFEPVRFTTRYISDFTRLNPDVTPTRDGWSTAITDFLRYERQPLTSATARALTIRPATRPTTEFRMTKAEFERRARAPRRP